MLNCSYSSTGPDNLQEWAEAERSGSAISPEVWQANVRLYEGWLATEMFFAANHLAEEERWLLKRYSHLEAGLWWMQGERLLERPLVPYAKPRRPRSNREGKLIKYENPPRLPAYPILPVMPGRTWRQVLDDPSIPVAIVEGAKKAMSLVSHGLAAVAIRGITLWHAAGERTPWPELALLAQGRTVYLFPDQDEKVRTRSDVFNQNRKLAKALERCGAKVRVVLWDGALGKGIDDVLAALPDPRAWLQQALAEAKDSLDRAAALAQARRLLAESQAKAALESFGSHVGQLQPRQRTVLWLDAPMGSGKTTALGEMARAWIRERQGQVLVLSPLNSLGQQTACRWDIPHIHDYEPKDALWLEMDVAQRGGLVACVNSAERIEAALDPERPLLLILDEANQVLADAAEGQTLRDRWAEKLAVFERLLQRAECVVAAEAGIQAASVQLLQSLTGYAELGYRLRRPAGGPGWTVYSYGNVHTLRSEVVKRLQQGQKLLLVTTSQREARRWEAWAEQHGLDKVFRIDSETNEAGRYREFFWDPNRWLEEHRPNLLVMSPSGRSGLSIEHPTAFDAVVGIFPGLDGDTCLQLLGRYRLPVPRLVWRPELVPTEADEQYNTARVRLELLREVETYGGDPRSLDSPWIRFYLSLKRRRWAQKIAARASLLWALEEAGHRITTVAEPPMDPSLRDEFRRIDAELREQDARAAAELSLDPTYHTPQWAKETLAALDSSHHARLRAHKVLLSHEFPGADWHNPQTWLAAVYSRNPLQRKVKRWVGSAYLHSAQTYYSRQAQRLLSAIPTPAHRLPRELFDWGLAARFRPLVLKLLEQGQVHPEGEVENQIYKLALQYRRDIARYWNLNVHEKQSVTAVVNKVLRKLGLEVERQQILTLSNGRRGWLYRILQPELWLPLATAYNAYLQKTLGWQPDPNAEPIPPALTRPGGADPPTTG